MKDKEKEKDENIISSGRDDKMNLMMPKTENKKIYHSFDDVKIRQSRLVDWKIIKRIHLDNDKVSKNLLRALQKEIEEFYWIFDSEQTIIFYAKAADENGRYDKQIGTCYFIRTKEGGWFSAYSNKLWWCKLDADNRWYNELVKE